MGFILCLVARYQVRRNDERNEIHEMKHVIDSRNPLKCATADSQGRLIMAALRSRCGHCVLQLWLLSFLLFSFFFLSFFLPYSQPLQIGCLPHFHTWCGLSANLGCRSERCCTRLAENTGRKNSPSAHHRTILSFYILATKTHIDNRKKLVKQQYLL